MKKKNPILELISQGEHQQLDFKFEVSNSKKIARTLCAFANTDGGTLLIGVKDNGNIAGIRSDEEYYMIEAAAEMYCRPCVPFWAQDWDINGKTVLEVKVNRSFHKPHLAPDKNDAFKAYIRVQDENILANEILIMGWKKQANLEGTHLKITKPVERLLIYLDKNTSIAATTFCKIGKINYRTSVRVLSDLLAINVLKYEVKDKKIAYALNPTFPSPPDSR